MSQDSGSNMTSRSTNATNTGISDSMADTNSVPNSNPNSINISSTEFLNSDKPDVSHAPCLSDSTKNPNLVNHSNPNSISTSTTPPSNTTVNNKPTSLSLNMAADTAPSPVQPKASQTGPQYTIVRTPNSAYVFPRHLLPILLMLTKKIRPDFDWKARKKSVVIWSDSTKELTATNKYLDSLVKNDNDLPPSNLPASAQSNSSPNCTDVSNGSSLKQTQVANTNTTSTNAAFKKPLFTGNSSKPRDLGDSRCEPAQFHPDDSSAKHKGEENESEHSEHVRGLYHQVTKSKWECLFRTPTGVCPHTFTDKRFLQLHIEKHAKEEERDISEGKLLPERAVAIPRLMIREYVCNIASCRYLLENSTPYRVVDHQVDNQKAKHLQNYHPELMLD